MSWNNKNSTVPLWSGNAPYEVQKQTLYSTDTPGIGITDGNEIALPTEYSRLQINQLTSNEIILNNNTLTADNSVLYINGQAIGSGGSGGDPSTWYQYMAFGNVNMNGFDINSVDHLHATTGSFTEVFTNSEVVQGTLTVNDNAVLNELTSPNANIQTLTSAYSNTETAEIQTANINTANIQTVTVTDSLDAAQATIQTVTVPTVHSTNITNEENITSNQITAETITGTQSINTQTATITGTATTDNLISSTANITNLTANTATIDDMVVNSSINADTLDVTTINSSTINNTGTVTLQGDNASLTGSFNTSSIHGNQYLNDINNIRNGYFNNLTIQTMWNGNNVLPPYQAPATLTVGDGGLNLNGNAVVTFHGGNNLFEDTLTTYGKSSFFGGITCYPLDVTANALTAQGITSIIGDTSITGLLFVTGMIEVTGLVTCLANISIAGTAEMLGAAIIGGLLNANGGIALIGALACGAGDVSFGSPHTPSSNNWNWDNYFKADFHKGIEMHGTTLENADTVSANTLVGDTYRSLSGNGITVEDDILLNSKNITDAGSISTTNLIAADSISAPNLTVTNINGQPYIPGGSPAALQHWALYPAIQDVNMDEQNITNVAQADIRILSLYDSERNLFKNFQWLNDYLCYGEGEELVPVAADWARFPANGDVTGVDTLHTNTVQYGTINVTGENLDGVDYLRCDAPLKLWNYMILQDTGDNTPGLKLQKYQGDEAQITWDGTTINMNRPVQSPSIRVTDVFAGSESPINIQSSVHFGNNDLSDINNVNLVAINGESYLPTNQWATCPAATNVDMNGTSVRNTYEVELNNHDGSNQKASLYYQGDDLFYFNGSQTRQLQIVKPVDYARYIHQQVITSPLVANFNVGPITIFTYTFTNMAVGQYEFNFAGQEMTLINTASYMFRYMIQSQSGSYLYDKRPAQSANDSANGYVSNNGIFYNNAVQNVTLTVNFQNTSANPGSFVILPIASVAIQKLP